VPDDKPSRIVPRWEWRTFGAAFPEADAALASLAPERTQESDEVYLLSTHSDASVKYRDDVVDVKRLEQVNDDGLELWRPVLKASFPLSADDVAAVLDAVAVDVPPAERSSYSMHEFAAEIVAPHPDLRGLGVHKHRTHYLVDECMVERTVMTTPTGELQTIAIESPDAAVVVATIARLSLAGHPNVNVASGLKTFIDFGSRRHAVIDVGTNSVKFFCAEQRADATVRVIVDRSDVTRLGEGLDISGTLAPEAIDRTVTAIANMADEARNASAGTSVVGTAGLRSAANSADFVAALVARTGLEIEIISGDEEGRLAYVAAVSLLPPASGVRLVFDSGGGSTQFTFGRGDAVEERFSIDVGAARIADRYGLTGTVSKDRLAECLAAIGDDLSVLNGRPRPLAVVAMGGTVTNLASVKHAMAEYDPEVVRNTVLDVGEIDRQIELYRARTVEQRRDIVGLQPNRAAVILAGACIVRTIVTKVGQESLQVSDRGLRHALFAERVRQAPRP
jgi:exopolyphosphatase/guanosine-5'-triphosphate,3'-diphosphate pyrophosphatase